MVYRISHYTGKRTNSWTSIYDILSPSYHMTIDKYIELENLHILCLYDIINVFPDDELVLINLEKPNIEQYIDWNLSIEPFRTINEDITSELFKNISDHRKYNRRFIINLLRFLLREEIWFQIACNYFKIDVGYDYYIHIYTDSIISNYSMLKNKYIKYDILIDQFTDEQFENL